MTDDTELTEDEKIADEARKLADIPAVKIPDAAGLPDDVHDGNIED